MSVQLSHQPANPRTIARNAGRNQLEQQFWFGNYNHFEVSFGGSISLGDELVALFITSSNVRTLWAASSSGLHAVGDWRGLENMETAPGKPTSLAPTCLGVLLGFFVVIVLLLNAKAGYPAADCDALICPPPPWNPPMWRFIERFPLLSGVLLATSTLLAVVGFVAARATKGKPATHWLQLLPILPIVTITGVALLSLFLFPRL